MQQLPSPLINPWFDATFYGDVSPDGGISRHALDGKQWPFERAQGVGFWCPCGFGALDKDGNERYPLDLSLNKGRPHWVMVPFTNGPGGPLPPNHGPHSRGDKNTHPRWSMSGTGLHDLSTTPSVSVGEPECWHGYITNGIVK